MEQNRKNRNYKNYGYFGLFVASILIFIIFAYSKIYTNEIIHYPLRRRNAMTEKDVEDLMKNMKNFRKFFGDKDKE